jgi:molybdate transport system substrate-binding protein
VTAVRLGRFRSRAAAPLAWATLAVLALAACGSTGGSSATTAGTSAGAAGTGSSAHLGGSVTVLAAASLTTSFTAIGTAFESANPGTHVRFSFGASSTLAQQIIQGAPADVFASASTTNMQQVVDAKAASGPVNFARNVLEIAVPPANPAKIATLADLARPGVTVALCQPQVPCGALAQRVLRNAEVTVTPATLEQDVTATLTKVRLGEVDAGLVYVTDIRSAGTAVKGVPIPPDVDAATTYPIAALSAARNAELAQAFVRYVLSDAGRSELARAGFQSP